MGFPNYFLVVYDFIKFAKKNKILVGPGRGSAAGSLVAYSLGITDIDPIKYSLLFERFLNPERVSMPDIDIDFSDERRSEKQKELAEKMGWKYFLPEAEQTPEVYTKLKDLTTNHSLSCSPPCRKTRNRIQTGSCTPPPDAWRPWWPSSPRKSAGSGGRCRSRAA